MGIAEIMAATAKAVADAAAKAKAVVATSPKASAPSTTSTAKATTSSSPFSGAAVSNAVSSAISSMPTAPSSPTTPTAEPSSGRIGLADVATVPIESGSDITSKSYQQMQSDISKNQPMYESNKASLESGIRQIQAASPDTRWWIDTNLSGTQEENEIFYRYKAVNAMQRLSNENEKNWNEYKTSRETQYKQFTEAISVYPSGTTFQKSREGYNVILPKIDTMADSRKQLAIAEGLNKAIPGLGERYKALYGAWGSATETGRGIYNLGVSAIDFILPGQGQNLRAVAESDIKIGSGIFEQKMLGKDYGYKAVPSIWTDEGRTILNKLGSPGYIGAGAFEVASFYVGGKMLEPVLQVGGTVIKGTSNKLLTRSLLKGTVTTGEEALAGGGRIAATETAGKLSRFIPGAIKESDVMVNFEKWAVQGYKPGKTLIEVPVQGGLKQIGESSIQQEFIYQADKSAGRIWLSPTEQAEYAARIGKSGEITINFPRNINLPSETRIGGLYPGKLNMTANQEIFRTGFGGIRSRTATTFLKEESLGVELGTAKGESQAYRITDLVQPVKDVGYKEVEHPFKTMMEEGYSRTFVYEGGIKPGGIEITPYSGLGKQTVPLYEKAIWGLRKPGIFSREALGNFAKDVRATMTETIQIVKPSSFLSKGERLSGVSMNVPYDILGKAMLRGTTLGLIGTSKIGLTSYNIGKNKMAQMPNASMNVPSISEPSYGVVNVYGFGEIKSVHQQPQVKMNQPLQNEVFGYVPKYEMKPISEQVYINMPKISQMQYQQQKTVQVLVPEFKQEQISESVKIQMPRLSTITSPETFPSIPFIPYLPKMGGQGGDYGFGFDRYGKKKRFRQAKTIDPFKEMRNQMKEVMKVGF